MTLFQGIELIPDVQKYGGIASALLMAACGVLYRNYLRKDAEVKALTQKLINVSTGNIQALTSMEKFIDHLGRELPQVEDRITKTIRAEMESVRDIVIFQKSQLSETIKDTDERGAATS